MSRSVTALLLCLSSLFLTACGTSAPAGTPAQAETPVQTEPAVQIEAPVQTEAPSPTPEMTPEKVEEPDYSTGTPWLFSNLDGIVTADTPADPKNDFGLYANKELFVKNELPGSRATMGTMYDINPQVKKDLVNMFKGKRPGDHDARLAYDTFRLCMDWDGRNAQGVEPLRVRTDRLEAIDTLKDMSDYFLEVPCWDRSACLWTFQIGTDAADSGRTDINIVDDDSLIISETTRLLLGDSSKYADVSAKETPRWTARAELIKNLLLRLGYTEAEAESKLENCFAFEMLLAGAIPSRVQKYEKAMALDYKSYTREELLKTEGDLPVLEELESIGVP
ncbi:MAG: hypothetical protein IK136_02820, partial [Oscillospiraceae bacterium]|nr:hypothetical protein [Oscillospiraceae bacterium]